MSSAPIINTDHISIKLIHSLDEDGEYDAFTDVQVDILLRQQKIGSISAIIVDRQKLPEHYFLSAMDGHSADMQWIGTVLYDPRYGRTKLLSLCEYDDPEFDLMYIKSFEVDEEYRTNGSSDVGATALYQLLHHPFISGNSNYGCWRVSSAVYVLDAEAAMTKEEQTAHNVYSEKRRAESIGAPFESRPSTSDEAEETTRHWDARYETLVRKDANQFLRNGFFQDPAVARDGGSAARILVASHGHWREPLKTHGEATAVQFCSPRAMPSAPTGKDAELFSFLKTKCSMYHDSQPLPQDMNRIRTDVQRLVSLGGSISKSHALHVACANNVLDVVKLLLELEPTAVDGYDRLNFTPLMVAASSAAGRKSNAGIPEVHIVDYLLAAGAKKSLQDSDGMTAYGHFKKKTADYALMMQAMMGGSSQQISAVHSSVQALERKLLPSDGPTAADLSGGEGPSSGFVDYSQEDKDHDKMMGDSSDEGDY